MSIGSAPSSLAGRSLPPATGAPIHNGTPKLDLQSSLGVYSGVSKDGRGFYFGSSDGTPFSTLLDARAQQETSSKGGEHRRPARAFAAADNEIKARNNPGDTGMYQEPVVAGPSPADQAPFVVAGPAASGEGSKAEARTSLTANQGASADGRPEASADPLGGPEGSEKSVAGAQQPPGRPTSRMTRQPARLEPPFDWLVQMGRAQALAVGTAGEAHRAGAETPAGVSGPRAASNATPVQGIENTETLAVANGDQSSSGNRSGGEPAERGSSTVSQPDEVRTETAESRRGQEASARSAVIARNVGCVAGRARLPRSHRTSELRRCAGRAILGPYSWARRPDDT